MTNLKFKKVEKDVVINFCSETDQGKLTNSYIVFGFVRKNCLADKRPWLMWKKERLRNLFSKHFLMGLNFAVMIILKMLYWQNNVFDIKIIHYVARYNILAYLQAIFFLLQSVTSLKFSSSTLCKSSCMSLFYQIFCWIIVTILIHIWVRGSSPILISWTWGNSIIPHR